MSERDYIQRPVDVGYEQGIQQMGRGRRVSAAEWLETIARTMAMGLAMRGGVGSPSFSPAQREAVLRDLKNAMGRLLRGNAPPKEPNPEIVRQLTSLGQRADSPRGFTNPYQRMVPTPELPRRLASRSYDIPDMPFINRQPIVDLRSTMWGDVPVEVQDSLTARGLWP